MQGKRVGEGNKSVAILGWRLQFLREIGSETAYLIDMRGIQRQVVDLDTASSERHKAQHGPQQGCLAASTLA